ncbi:MAG: hypothetical protein NDJ89_08335 [Oligoflexia bacterium]|nr:hypothetical protein [Oligoflexia bacterium]
MKPMQLILTLIAVLMLTFPASAEPVKNVDDASAVWGAFVPVKRRFLSDQVYFFPDKCSIRWAAE